MQRLAVCGEAFSGGRNTETILSGGGSGLEIQGDLIAWIAFFIGHDPGLEETSAALVKRREPTLIEAFRDYKTSVSKEKNPHKKAGKIKKEGRKKRTLRRRCGGRED